MNGDHDDHGDCDSLLVQEQPWSLQEQQQGKGLVFPPDNIMMKMIVIWVIMVMAGMMTGKSVIIIKIMIIIMTIPIYFQVRQ